MTTQFALNDLLSMNDDQRRRLYRWIDGLAENGQSGPDATPSQQHRSDTADPFPVLSMSEGVAKGDPFRLDVKSPSFRDDRTEMRKLGWSWDKNIQAMVPKGY